MERFRSSVNSGGSVRSREYLQRLEAHPHVQYQSSLGAASGNVSSIRLSLAVFLVLISMDKLLIVI